MSLALHCAAAPRSDRQMYVTLACMGVLWQMKGTNERNKYNFEDSLVYLFSNGNSMTNRQSNVFVAVYLKRTRTCDRVCVHEWECRCRTNERTDKQIGGECGIASLINNFSGDAHQRVQRVHSGNTYIVCIACLCTNHKQYLPFSVRFDYFTAHILLAFFYCCHLAVSLCLPSAFRLLWQIVGAQHVCGGGVTGISCRRNRPSLICRFAAAWTLSLPLFFPFSLALTMDTQYISI